MAKRSLNSIWQNVEKCYQGYKNDKTSLNEAEDKLKELMAKEDVQTIINDLVVFFFLSSIPLNRQKFVLVLPKTTQNLFVQRFTMPKKKS